MNMERIDRQEIYNGRVINVYNDKVELSNGKTTYREVVEHHQVAAIVAVDEDNNVLIEKQYRYPVQSELLEIPAGLIDEGESPLQAARRELLEETGYEAEEWVKVLEYFTSPGMHNEVVHLFIATGLKRVSGQSLDSDEELSFDIMPLDEIIGKIYNDEIKDGKTIIGLLIYKNRYGIVSR